MSDYLSGPERDFSPARGSGERYGEPGVRLAFPAPALRLDPALVAVVLRHLRPQARQPDQQGHHLGVGRLHRRVLDVSTVVAGRAREMMDKVRSVLAVLASIGASLPW